MNEMMAPSAALYFEFQGKLEEVILFYSLVSKTEALLQGGPDS